ncbi:MAG: hypothetical protein LBL52_04015 [Rickettsiales bacterium]|jgi:hypothetical protein|nr:hypothetical protein [Rickettsiales bacterium]
MNKLLTAGLLLASVSANAGVGIENPFYRPSEGKFYSITDLNKSDDRLQALETFGYGFSNKFAMSFGFDLDRWSKNSGRDDGVGNWDLGANYSALNRGGQLLDVLAHVGGAISDDVSATGDTSVWGIGVRGGKVKDKYTYDGKITFDRLSASGYHDSIIHFVLEGLYQFTPKFSGYLALDDEQHTQKGIDDSFWFVVQGNLVISANSAASVYYKTDIGNDDNDDVFGVKYGVQF